jgi:plasmid stability protein
MADDNEEIEETEEESEETEEDSDDDSEDSDDSVDEEAERKEQKRRSKVQMDRGRRAERRAILKELGLSNMDELRETLKKKGNKADSDSDDTERKEAIAKAEARERKALEREAKAVLREALAGKVDPKNMEAAMRLAWSEVDLEEDDVEDEDFALNAIEAIEEIASALFSTSSDEDDDEDEEPRHTSTLKGKRTQKDKRTPAKTSRATANKKYSAYKKKTRRTPFGTD